MIAIAVQCYNLTVSCIRFRTAINVLGDSLGAGLVYHLSKDDLEEMGDVENMADTRDEPKQSGGNVNMALQMIQEGDVCNERL